MMLPTNSYFDGKLSQQVGYKILGIAITLLTFGVCYPFAFILMYKWEAKHTVIQGNRLKFIGSASSLFWLWIKQYFFIIITGGIYFFWIQLSIKRWVMKNTVFEKF